LVTAVELEKVIGEDPPSTVMSNQSFISGREDIVPRIRKEPEKSFVYTAIVCNALLLLSPGLASIELEVLDSGPLPVKEDIVVLLTASGYAPSSTSKVPPAV
jgi:hypothetical protein